jgi:hypothetical protein
VAEVAPEKLGTEAQRHDASLHAARKEYDAVLEDGSADGEGTGSLSSQSQS